MKPAFLQFLLFSFLCVWVCSCTKTDTTDDPGSPGGGSGIYAIYSTGSQHFNRKAKLWHDNTDAVLEDRTSKVYLNDLAIAANGDVYVSGCECTWSRYPTSPNQKDDSCRLLLWKNNVKQTLTQVPFSSITKAYVFVTVAGDVYVTGSERSLSSGAGTIRLWKNGVASDITNGTTDAIAGSLYVNGNDVYIGGSQKPITATNTTATLWKNGAAQPLSGATSYFDNVVAIQVNGTDVYTAVQESASGWVAKNGVKQTQPSGIQTIKDIFLSGSDLYILGKTNITTTGVWKNGVLLYNLTYNGISDFYDGGQAVYVKDGDVYVTGTTTVGASTNAVIWKNGTIIHTLAQPGSSLTTAEGIVVK